MQLKTYYLLLFFVLFHLLFLHYLDYYFLLYQNLDLDYYFSYFKTIISIICIALYYMYYSC